MELNGQIHIPAALLPMKEPNELGAPYGQSGHIKKQKHLLTFQKIKPQPSHCTDYAVPPPEWSIWTVISDITRHLCHSTYISLNETEDSKIQFTITSGSIMYFSRFSQQLLKCWVSLGPLLYTGIYFVAKCEEQSVLSPGWLNGIQATQWKKMCQKDRVLKWGSCKNNVTSGERHGVKTQKPTICWTLHFCSCNCTLVCYWLQYISVASFWLHLLQY